jgi:hypothetical protein
MSASQFAAYRTLRRSVRHGDTPALACLCRCNSPPLFLLRLPPPLRICTSLQAEEKAVDLYVLERAVLSAHSTPEEEEQEEEEAGGDDEGEDGEEDGGDSEGEGGGDDAPAGAGAARRNSAGADDGSGSSSSAGPFRVHPNPPSSCKGPAFAPSAGVGRGRRAVDAVSADVTTAAGFFAAVLASYLAAVRDSREIGRRYEIVRRRGRKRLAFG